MKILYLYAELMGYQIPVFKEYVNSYDAEVHVVHWDHKKLTPYTPPEIQSVKYYNRSEFNTRQLIAFVEKIKPDIVYVSGWMDKGYLYTCGFLRKKGVTVLAGCDTQWRGDIKQKIGRIYFRFFLKRFFSHIWVAGPYQYEYARKLGFKKNEILFNCLTADVELFAKTFTKEKNKNSYPKHFLFLGRFESVKGIDLLLEAWGNIIDKKDWTLTFIGNGSLKNKLIKSKDITVKDFLQPNDLAAELTNYGCLVLPSLKEPWALVIHEAMASGIPVIASDACGAAPSFIIPEYTGFIFKSGDLKDLTDSLTRFINLSENKLFELSANSFERSNIINSKIVAASLVYVFNR